MTGQLSPADDATLREVYDLADALLSREISAADSARLARLVSEDAEARRHYIRFMHDSALLGEWGREASGVARAASTPPDDDLNPQPIVLDLSSPSDASTPFVGGFVFSYMVATVFVCLLLLGFWAYKLPSDRGSSIASNENSRGLTDPGESSPDRPVPVFVGRVTGIAGAKWSDEPNYIAPMGFRVALGRTYKLKSGLLEITYDSGARVILEGPCSYEVDSTAGGYLALGKLVARVEGGERRVESDNSRRLTASGNNTEMARTPEAVSLRLLSKSPNPRIPESPNAFYPLSPLPSPLFVVRTPTAVVTDLGTEFGVEVDQNGTSDVTVFLGMVAVAMQSADSTETTRELAAGESARVEWTADGGGRIVDSPSDLANQPERFARQLLPLYTQTVLADRPLFYWTFNEPSGPAFEQVRRLPHQSLVPRAGAGRCRHDEIGSGLALGRAAEFDWEGAFVSGMMMQGQSLPGAWAIEFWIQPLGNQRTRSVGQFVMNAGLDAEPAQYAFTNPGVIFNWPQDAEECELQLFREKWGPTRGGPILADDRWRHVVFAFYGNGDKFGVADRVDVVLDGQHRRIERSGFTAGFGLNGRLWLGGEGPELRYPFHGRIDELVIYDLGELTEQQIEARITDIGRRHFEAARNSTLPLAGKGQGVRVEIKTQKDIRLHLNPPPRGEGSIKNSPLADGEGASNYSITQLPQPRQEGGAP